MGVLQLEFGRGDVLAERYEVVDRLDESPLGITYRARHTQTGAYARVLMLDPAVAGREQKQQLIDAVKLARRLNHRNLLKVNELTQHGGVALIAYEDVEGARTLREVLDEAAAHNTPFSLKDASQITIQILEGARALHDLGHTFRSLRPEYVLLTQRRTGPRGQTIVYDVRLWGASIWDLVQPGKLAEDEFGRGEASYLAPELKGVQPSVTPRADVYSVGVMFYELLCGQAPVGTYQLPRQRRPELPAHLDSVVELALANAPEDRYPTAADFVADVQRTFQASGDEGLETAKNGWLVWVLGGLLVVALLVLLFVNGSSDPYERALAADNELRKGLWEAYVKPDKDEVNAILGANPPNMVYIPPGKFVTGRLSHEPNDGSPTATVEELPGFLIDAFEYPNLAKGEPKQGVTWSEASELCTAQGKRLCTAPELEKACRGPENHVYGYGDTWDVEKCGNGVEEAHVAGQYADCKSNWGVYDIAGNFREWTASEKGAGRKLVKGGMPKTPAKGTRCAYSSDLNEGYTDATLSFRCCKDAGTSSPAPAPAALPPAAP